MNKHDIEDGWFNLGYKRGANEVFEIMRPLCEAGYHDNGVACGWVKSKNGQCNFADCPMLEKISKYMEDVK